MSLNIVNLEQNSEHVLERVRQYTNCLLSNNHKYTFAVEDYERSYYAATLVECLLKGHDFSKFDDVWSNLTQECRQKDDVTICWDTTEFSRWNFYIRQCIFRSAHTAEVLGYLQDENALKIIDACSSLADRLRPCYCLVQQENLISLLFSFFEKCFLPEKSPPSNLFTIFCTSACVEIGVKSRRFDEVFIAMCVQPMQKTHQSRCPEQSEKKMILDRFETIREQVLSDLS